MGPYTLSWGRRTYLMGIVNASPDSFAGDGAPSPAVAVARGRRLVEEGADLLDVGGESTRPGAPPVAAPLQLERILPVLAGLAGLGVPLSVDTSSATVARAALAAGAWLVNDVTGLRGDPQMAGVVAGHGAGLVLMANHRLPLPAGGEPGGDVVALTLARWREGLRAAAAAGVPAERIILDPGLGFGLPAEGSLALLRRLPELRRAAAGCRSGGQSGPVPAGGAAAGGASDPRGGAGYPILVGPSRKGFIGAALGGLPVAERLEGTLAAVALAVAGGADVVRVHDVRAAHRVLLVADAVCRPGGRPGETP